MTFKNTFGHLVGSLAIRSITELVVFQPRINVLRFVEDHSA